MANFTFKLTSNIILGSYSIAKIGAEAVQFGKKFLFIVDPLLHETGIAKKIIDALEDRGISVLVFDRVKRSADSDIIENALGLARGVFIDAAQSTTLSKGNPVRRNRFLLSKFPLHAASRLPLHRSVRLSMCVHGKLIC